MKRTLISILALSAALFGTGRLSVLSQPQTKVDFGRDVQPLLREHCVSCHGPSQQMQGLRLDRRRDAMNIAGRRVIYPGSSAESRLYVRIAGNQLGLQMPPTGPLSAGQIALIKRWIDEGADWPDEFSGETPPTRTDSRAAQLMDALRKGERQTFTRLLGNDPTSINARGPAGSTPLMYAALYGDSDSMQLLLERGADPNIQNDAGATALMWAADDLAKTRLLLNHGADPNIRSADARTALTAALLRSASAAIVKELLDRGAKLTETSGVAPLTLASRAADDATIKLLIERGADTKTSRLALTYAVRTNCDKCVDLLLDSAGQDDLNAALMEAAQNGNTAAVRRLLERQADVNATVATAPQSQSRFNVLMAAAFSEFAPAEAVRALIERGADIRSRNSNGETALDFAARQGNTPIVDLLRNAGAPGSASEPSKPTTKPADSAPAAVLRSIPLLQRSDVTFLRKGGCVSCHNNSLTAITIASARKQRLNIDEQIARQQLQAVASYIESWRERVLQGDGIPGLQNTIGYILSGMAAEHYPSDPATDALARYLKNTQLPDGRWWNLDGHMRPPIDSSDIQVTAMAIRATQVYAPQPQRAAYQIVVERAANWLSKAQSRTTEDRAFQLLGLAWAGTHKDVIRRAARDLIAQQRPDGGWGQLPSLASDAYATGQSLVALKQSGAVTTNDAAYQHGVRFLLNTQTEDGSWFVKSRSIPIMPYFESDFPHGRDQFISAAATNWATQALIK
jgi:ankyrin repeat protein